MAVKGTDGQIYVDNSILSAVASCDYRAVLRYVLDRRPQRPNYPAEVGRFCHEAVEAYLLGAEAEDALDILRAGFVNWWSQYGDPMFERLSPPNVIRVMEGWFETHPKDSLPYDVYKHKGVPLVEHAFELPFGELVPPSDDEGLYYFGRIDTVVRHKQTGAIYILDTKTTGRPDYQMRESFKLSSQMSGYWWAVEQEYGLKVAGVWINVIHLPQLPGFREEAKTCKTHRVPTSQCNLYHAQHQLWGPYLRHPAEIVNWKSDALYHARRFKKMVERFETLDDEQLRIGLANRARQQGRWIYKACSFCDFKELCETGRSEGAVRQFTVVDQWDPRA